MFENLNFDGLLLSKAHEVLEEKVRKSLCLMTLESDVKFEEKLTLGSKNDMRNLVKFNANSGKSENLHFDILLLSKVYYVWAKNNTEELCVITLKNDPKFKEELTFCLKNGKEFGEFWPNTRKSQNLHFNGFLLTKVYNVWAKRST